MALVGLRLVIGWHFFMEGASHHADRGWSSEGFLRQAKGPFAPYYSAYLPTFHGWDELFHGQYQPARAREAFENGVGDDWTKLQGDFNLHYQATPEQKTQAAEIVKSHKRQLADWLDDNGPDLAEHVDEWRRLEKDKAAASAADVPFEKGRIETKQRELAAAAGPWLAELKGLEKSLRDQLSGVLKPDQAERGPLSGESSPLARIDRVMMYWIWGVGACLLLGLFTRLASLSGAAFLLSVVATQPFWVAGTAPTYLQWVELVALLALATTQVGRWGGLDWFVHNLLVRPCCGAKGTDNASDS